MIHAFSFGYCGPLSQLSTIQSTVTYNQSNTFLTVTSYVTYRRIADEAFGLLVHRYNCLSVDVANTRHCMRPDHLELKRAHTSCPVTKNQLHNLTTLICIKKHWKPLAS
uniref:Uncharacterized protein n=1 Tax=Opuntia streptacantha TaxID=393608 RepID=A0A7C8ZBS1_OPUST